MISDQEIKQLVDTAPASEKAKILEIANELALRKQREVAKTDFLEFVKAMWPDVIIGPHHKRMAKLFEDAVSGKKRRIILNMAPRHGKSEFTSWLLPAWFLGKFPERKVIQCSNTAELAESFGRKVRNLLESEDYTRIFPDVTVRSDSRAAGRWNTTANGTYFAVGVGGTCSGIGAHLALIDDPHSEQEALTALTNPKVYDKVFEWYTSAIRQRMQPGGIIVIIQTRWSLRDLTAQVLEQAAKADGEQWEVIEFPAILPSGKPLWPEYWPLEELIAVKNSIPNSKWQAQYQQCPTSDETAIIKREWWRTWEKDKPPSPDYILMSLDTAHETKTINDYSACIVFGVWKNQEDNENDHIIMLDAWRDKVEYPQLKKEFLRIYKEWEPDSCIIEKKAAGAPLIQELRWSGVYAQEFTPSRGNDKITRLNAIADIFASGKVWAPKTRWAEEIIDEIASFPAGKHDDFCDVTSMALAFIRKGGMVRATLDEEDEPSWMYRRKAAYY